MSNKRTKLDFSKFYKNVHYPSEDTSLKSSIRYRNNEINLPLENLLSAYESKSVKLDPNEKYAVHWFRKDLRTTDNTAFKSSIETALKNDLKVIGLYVISTKLWRNHLDSPWKIDLILRRLKELEKSLNQLNIPLSVVYFDDAKTQKSIKFHTWFADLINNRFKTNTVYLNIIYDLDELDRDLSLLSNTQLNLNVCHDECIVKPLTLQTGKGTEFKKFTPWYKKWTQFLDNNPIDILQPKSLDKWDHSWVGSDEYKLDESFGLSSLSTYGTTSKDITNFQKEYPVDNAHISKVVDSFIKTSKIKEYETAKSSPHSITTSRLSPYITIGAISTREVVSEIMKAHKFKKINSANSSIQDFIKEIAWRDFYKHVLVSNPFLEFDLPFNFNSLDLDLSNSESNFAKWCLGKTGYPIIDASMRELLHTGYMNNRCRMLCASFLTKDLFIDWRWGMNWFSERLVDGEYSSNHGGWTWTSSVGVDCQPWFRFFNVERQGRIHDPDGEYIKKWCHELKGLDKGKVHTGEGVHDYPDPIALLSKEERQDKYREVM